MTEIGSNPMGHGPAGALPRASWGQRFDALFDSLVDFLTKVLCRASRGYLCPPDMTSVMYPDEPRPLNPPMSNARVKECCDEKLPRK
jgi:hypothetical protein